MKEGPPTLHGSISNHLTCTSQITVTHCLALQLNQTQSSWYDKILTDRGRLGLSLCRHSIFNPILHIYMYAEYKVQEAEWDGGRSGQLLLPGIFSFNNF